MGLRLHRVVQTAILRAAVEPAQCPLVTLRPCLICLRYRRADGGVFASTPWRNASLRPPWKRGGRNARLVPSRQEVSVAGDWHAGDFSAGRQPGPGKGKSPPQRLWAVLGHPEP